MQAPLLTDFSHALVTAHGNSSKQTCHETTSRKILFGSFKALPHIFPIVYFPRRSLNKIHRFKGVGMNFLPPKGGKGRPGLYKLQLSRSWPQPCGGHHGLRPAPSALSFSVGSGTESIVTEFGSIPSKKAVRLVGQTRWSKAG